jgi:L-iditol 2-dehydrogenase
MVAEIDPGVEHVSPGDRVTAHLAIGCGHREYCLRGYTMLCARWKCLGFDVDGGDADYFVIPERNCLPLPNEVSFVAGALMTDMIGSQHYTQKILGVRGGMNVALIGLGPMGAAALLIAKASGANAIAADLLPARLELAAKLGADVLINAGEHDVVEAIREATRGRGADVAIDCSGAPAGQNAALDAVCKHGAVAFIGESCHPNQSQRSDHSQAAHRRRRLVFSARRVGRNLPARDR